VAISKFHIRQRLHKRKRASVSFRASISRLSAGRYKYATQTQCNRLFSKSVYNLRICKFYFAFGSNLSFLFAATHDRCKWGQFFGEGVPRKRPVVRVRGEQLRHGQEKAVVVVAVGLVGREGEQDGAEVSQAGGDEVYENQRI
jgi:hypothetical protein